MWGNGASFSQEMSMATVECSCHGHVPACGVLGRAARAMLRDHIAVVRVIYIACACAEGRVFSASSIDDTTVSVRV